MSKSLHNINHNNTTNSRDDRRGYTDDRRYSNSYESNSIRYNNNDTNKLYNVNNNNEAANHINKSYNTNDNKRNRGYDDVKSNTSTSSASLHQDYQYQEKRYRRDDYHHRDESIDRNIDRRRNNSYDYNNNNNEHYHSTSRGRGGGATSNNNYDNIDWKCLECYTWNQPDDYNCRRCKAPVGNASEQVYDASIDRQNDDKYRNNNNINEDERKYVNTSDDERKPSHNLNDNDNNNDNDIDEFGRKINNNNMKIKLKNNNDWPPCFDTNGSLYIFDIRSSMFYNKDSDFYYDPKNKLYYSNIKKLYYKYNKDNKKHYEQINVNEYVGELINPNMKLNDNDLALDPILDNVNKKSNNTLTNGNEKNKISINLKTKKIKAKVVKSIDNTKQLLPVTKDTIKDDNDSTKKKVSIEIQTLVNKQHAADLDKWANRQTELRNEQVQEQRQINSSTSNNMNSNDPNVKEKSTKDIQKTEKGEPICLLCRRKFPTLAKLKYHEDVSTLHKENLAKQSSSNDNKANEVTKIDSNATVTTTTTANDIKYIDRAKQRRLLHEPVVTTTGINNKNDLINLSSSINSDIYNTNVIKTQHIRPEDTLGESNIGNQMLQKLGWKSGTNLGTNSTTTTADNNNSNNDNNTNANNSLTNEWKRIELLAAKNGEKQSNSNYNNYRK